MSIDITSVQAPSIPRIGRVTRLNGTVADSLVMVKRNLRHIPRTPELLADVTIMPIIFVVLFRYVFGGAIPIEGTTYVNYLMAGIFVQTVVFATVSSGIFLAHDLSKGLIDRFRSLPMSQSAVITGRTLTDLLRGALAVAVMLVVGLAVGFRPDGSAWGWLAGLGLLLLFGFAFSWIGVALGLLVRSAEVVQAGMFIAIFPLTFASSAFVPTDTMPRWLRVFAENQPITQTVDALRAFALGESAGSQAWQSLIWSVAIIAVFFPLSVALYRRRTTQ